MKSICLILIIIMLLWVAGQIGWDAGYKFCERNRNLIMKKEEEKCLKTGK